MAVRPTSVLKKGAVSERCGKFVEENKSHKKVWRNAEPCYVKITQKVTEGNSAWVDAQITAVNQSDNTVDLLILDDDRYKCVDKALHVPLSHLAPVQYPEKFRIRRRFQNPEDEERDHLMGIYQLMRDPATKELLLTNSRPVWKKIEPIKEDLGEHLDGIVIWWWGGSRLAWFISRESFLGQSNTKAYALVADPAHCPTDVAETWGVYVPSQGQPGRFVGDAHFRAKLLDEEDSF